MATFVNPENNKTEGKKRPVSLAPVREMVAQKEDAKGNDFI